MDSFHLDTSFSRRHSDPNVYTKKVGNHLIILVLYVDDLISKSCKSCKPSHLQVLQTKEGIFHSQSKYACDLIRYFHMEDCKPTPSPLHFGVKLDSTCTSPEVDATLYHQLVGSLLYLTHSRPDLSFAVGHVSRYMQTPHENHWKATKIILRHI